MNYGSFRSRYKLYRRYNRWWPLRAGWYAFTEDGRAVVVLLAVFAMLLLWKCDAHAQVGDSPNVASPLLPDPAPTPAPKMACYIPITPVQGGLTAYLGPWSYVKACKDVAGSMMYTHDWRCHLGNLATCPTVFGNGYAYPSEQPYPPAWNIVGNPVMLPLGSQPAQHGWVGLYYPMVNGKLTGAVVFYKPVERAKYAAMVAAGQGIFPVYPNAKCPHAPYTDVGTLLGQPDWVCN